MHNGPRHLLFFLATGFLVVASSATAQTVASAAPGSSDLVVSECATGCGDLAGFDDDNIVWGTMWDENDNIVWGTASVDDNIVWGTGGIEGSFSFGSQWEDDNIVWGTMWEDDNIVWGTSNVAPF
mgnify:CR=1 FL=1